MASESRRDLGAEMSTQTGTAMNITVRIQALKAERKAVILAHTYQSAEIQELADYVGDSYGLSVKASSLADADLIVFCGVRFMAETAAILNPGKTVVMPDAGAGCAMAAMIDAEQLRRFKAKHPGAPVVCYVNSTAEVKAESTICCTSSNAEKIVRSLGDVPEILFVPDQYLGHFVERRLGRRLVLWDGCCPIHRGLAPELISEARAQHPEAKVMVHPETRPEVQAAADYVLSTGQMLDLVKTLPPAEYIVGTECGILHALRKASPGSKFYELSRPLVCGDMKKTTPEKVLGVLESCSPRITVSEDIAVRARKSIEAMLAVK